jgi:hypothetical protein
LPIAEGDTRPGRLLGTDELAEILRLAWDPGLCVPDLLAALEGSPALTCELRRVADSSLYDMEGRITRLERAVLILGVPAVAEIATGLWARERLGATGWTHPLEVAVTGRLIAEILDPGLRMPAWVAGLLHGSRAARLRPRVASESALAAVLSAAHLLAPSPVHDAEPDPRTVLDDLGLLPDDVAEIRARAELRSKEALRIYAG